MPEPLDYSSPQTNAREGGRPWGCLVPGLILSLSSIPAALLKVDPDAFLPFLLLWGGVIVLGLGFAAVVFAKKK